MMKITFKIANVMKRVFGSIRSFANHLPTPPGLRSRNGTRKRIATSIPGIPTPPQNAE